MDTFARPISNSITLFMLSDICERFPGAPIIIATLVINATYLLFSPLSISFTLSGTVT